LGGVAVPAVYASDRDGFSGKVDFSGLVEFVRIAKILVSDNEPSESDWEALFSTPGYACLTYSEFTKEFFRERFSLALRPSLASQLAERMKTDKWGLLEYYSSLAIRLDELESVARQGELEDGRSLVARAVEMCKPYFPPGADFTPPPISAVVFWKLDGRGYVPIVIDAAYWLDHPADLVYILGHEIFHVVHNRIMRFRLEDAEPDDADLLWVLKQTQFEGIADQIGGPLHSPMTRHTQDYVADYARRVREQESFIPAVARGLALIGRDPSMTASVGTELRKNLLWSGHFLGDYMADLIIETLGPEALKAGMDNPFAFYYLYNEAAAKAGKPVLSPEALRTLKGLESKYLRSNGRC
jgi:hypothetical protein